MTNDIIVKPNEIDPYNVVHHSIYLCWYEFAIVEYCKSQEGNSIIPSVLETYYIKNIKSKYIGAAKSGDYLIIQTSLIAVNETEKTIKFKQKIIKRNSKKTINTAELIIGY